MYVDAITVERVREFFPEVDPALFVSPHHLSDLDTAGLGFLEDGTLDFVIMSHVIEHLANPVKAIQEGFRVLAIGGRFLIAVPDKDFTFDRHRSVTSFEHLWGDFQNGVTENSDEHYLDFLRSAAPHVFMESEEKIAGHIRYSRLRREHAHAWTSRSFREFLTRSVELLGYRAEPLHESFGDENRGEYFGVWERRA